MFLVYTLNMLDNHRSFYRRRNAPIENSEFRGGIVDAWRIARLYAGWLQFLQLAFALLLYVALTSLHLYIRAGLYGRRFVFTSGLVRIWLNVALLIDLPFSGQLHQRVRILTGLHYIKRNLILRVSLGLKASDVGFGYQPD